MENWRFALSSIWGHKMRSILTMLGIIIGVAAVVVIMALGNAMAESVISSFSQGQQDIALYYTTESTSTNNTNLYVDDTSSGESVAIEEIWLQELTQLEGIENYYVTNTATSAIAFQNKTADNITLTGGNLTYFEVKDYDIVAGRGFREQDYSSFSSMIMLDTNVASKLFGDSQAAINQVVSLGDKDFLVIGVFQDPNAGSSTYSISSEGSALFTNTQLAAEFNQNEIGNAFVHISDAKRATELGTLAAAKLTDLSGAKEKGGSFTTFDTTSIVNEINTQFSIMTTIIGAIAGISLLVGGIGVMNIMLVSVTERTREIGLRKALGATRFKILSQFLIESVVLTMIGGLLGLLFAYGLTQLLTSVLSSSTVTLNPKVSLDVAFWAMSFSALIGIIFGLLPANKASRLNPIEALRYE